jgi:DNA (cytosine-5)-methyltransferase 1
MMARSNGKKKFKVVSLFSGAMGLDLGLEATGLFETLACVEKIPAFCNTIRHNRDHGRLGRKDVRVYEGDICNVDPETLMSELGIEPGELDLLVGGPPCQTFSTAGRRQTVQDPRGTLLWQFLRFVQVLQPKFFLMENVRGLISAALRHRPIKERPEHGGPPLAEDEEPGSVVKLFLADLAAKRLDYRLDCFEVNAVNYGAPQLRERAIFVGNRFGHVVEFPAPTHGSGVLKDNGVKPQMSLFNSPSSALVPHRTLGDAIKGIRDPNPVIMDFSPRKKSFLALIPPGGNWRCLPEATAKESMGKAFFAKGGRSGWWRRLSYDLPSPTIVTMPNHASTSLCHPDEVRALTVRECAAVQEFPPEWEFTGKTNEQYAQVGNAVPTRLGRVSGELLAQHLRSLETHPSIGTKAPRFRAVYVQSHVRTRQWYKDGQVFVWQDGEDNDDATYSAPKTQRRERKLEAGRH